MNGGEMILNRIKSDCDESIKAIELEAQKTCGGILADAEQQAQAAADEITAKNAKQLTQLEASSKSRAELEKRNALLRRRRKEIDLTLAELQKHLTELEDSEYFEYLYSLASQLKGKSGEVFVNARDLSRLPKDFEAMLSDAGIDARVNSAPVNISGGFILKSGDIEENMDFTALISARRDDIEDLINRELFAQ